MYFSGAHIMVKNKKMVKTKIEKSHSEIKVLISPDWKEIYMDGANVFIDNYSVRISCFSHIPNFTSSNEDIERVQKIDLIMSKNALKELVLALNNVLKDVEEAEIEEETKNED